MKTSEVEALAVLAEMSSFLEGKPLAAALRTLSAERDALKAEVAELRARWKDAHDLSAEDNVEHNRLRRAVEAERDEQALTIRALMDRLAEVSERAGKVSAERDALAAENARLRETGGKLLELWAKPSESNFEAFERIAHAFYRETGVMAPGKDAPAGSSQGEPEERRAKYNLWMERRVASFRDALTKESDQ